MDRERWRLYELQAEVIQAAGHPIRLAILEFLQDGERCVCDIAAAVGAGRSNVSRHLAVLLKAGRGSFIGASTARPHWPGMPRPRRRPWSAIAGCAMKFAPSRRPCRRYRKGEARVSSRPGGRAEASGFQVGSVRSGSEQRTRPRTTETSGPARRACSGRLRR